MSCFICNIVDEQLFNVELSQTNDGKVIYSDLLRSLVKDSYEFEIFADDAVCPTCCVLLEEIYKFKTKAQEIENILMTQIYRKYQVEATEPPIYSVNEQHLELFNLLPFAQKSLYNCHKCSFSTEYVDCLVPHYKLHESEANVDVKQELLDEHVFQCTHCEELLANIGLLRFHMRLFHPEASIEDADYSIEIVDAEETAEVDSDAKKSTIDDRVEEINHLRCPLCEFCSVQSQKIRTHLRGVHAKRSFRHARVQCQYCDSLFTSFDSMVAHSTAHPERIFKCVACDMVMSIMPVTIRCTKILNYCFFHFFHRHLNEWTMYRLISKNRTWLSHHRSFRQMKKVIVRPSQIWSMAMWRCSHAINAARIWAMAALATISGPQPAIKCSNVR